MYTHLDGPHSRVPVGALKIGRIVSERRAHLSNEVLTDPWIGDHGWAEREGMVAFAGYPLLVGDRPVGVIALFARHALDEGSLRAMSVIANTVAVGIERDRVEQALRDAEARARAVFESAADAIIVIDEAGLIESANPAAEAIFGHTTRELVGSDVHILMSEPDRSEHHGRVARYVATGEAHVIGRSTEVNAMRGDGSIFPIELTVSELWLGERRKFLGVARDISRRRRAEEGLAAALRERRQIMEAIRDIIYVLDTKGRLISWNPVTETVTGRDASRLWGRPAIEFFAPAQCPAVVDSVRRVLEVGTDEFEADLLRADETAVPFHFRSVRLTDAEGRVIGVTGVGRDITERRQSEAVLRHARDELEARVRERTAELERANATLECQAQELSRSNFELQQFAYIASHDLQEPLRMVSSYTELLAQQYKGRLDADADEFIQYAVDGAIRMQNMINDLLAYSRVGTKAAAFALTPVAAAVERAMVNLSITIHESGAVVTVGSLPALLCDPGQLVQLFQNLIGNAIKYRGEEGPRVDVSADRDGNQWHFAVRDNGIGIDPEYSDRIFEIFQRLHTRDEYPGNGIGLAICRKIVERHGGRIWVESQVGEGTTFHFTIPEPSPEERIHGDR